MVFTDYKSRKCPSFLYFLPSNPRYCHYALQCVCIYTYYAYKKRLLRLEIEE